MNGSSVPATTNFEEPRYISVGLAGSRPSGA